MTSPCEQIEAINQSREKAELQQEKLHVMEVRQVEIQGDVKHIKGRIDNGMSNTIANLNTLLTKLEPVINHHAKIVSKIEDIGWWISKSLIVFLVGALIGVLIWAVANGFKPSL